jgi:hypothetical protein
VDSALVQAFRRADLPDHVFTFDETRRWPEADREALLQLGILRQTDDAESLTCEACGDDEDVITGLGRELRVHCRLLGLRSVRPERVQQWDVDFGSLGRHLQAGLQLAGEIDEVAQSRIWMLGRRKVIDRAAEFFLIQGIAWPDSLNLLQGAARLHGSPAPIVLIPDRLPEQAEWRASGRAPFRLSEWTSLRDGQLVVEFDAFADLYRQTADAIDKPLEPTPVADRDPLIKNFCKGHGCNVNEISYWAHVDRSDLNRWKNGSPLIPDGGDRATRIEKLLQRGHKTRV